MDSVAAKTVMNLSRRDIKIGCCGFPERRAEYYNEFSVVEVQQTFYQPPLLKTAMKWRKEAPLTFEFTIKAWQLITHSPESPTYRRLKMKIPEDKKNRYGYFRPTAEIQEAWSVTEEIAEALQCKVIVFQSPARFTPTKENRDNLRRFFKTIDRKDYWLVWEPRGEWDRTDVLRLCRELNLIPCMDPFEVGFGHGDILYLRLHGIGGYRYRYDDRDLRFLLAGIGGLPRGVGAYCMFNNISMLDDARRFKAMST